MYMGAGKGGGLREDPPPAQPRGRPREVSLHGGHREKCKPAASGNGKREDPPQAKMFAETVHLFSFVDFAVWLLEWMAPRLPSSWERFEKNVLPFFL